MNKRQWNAFCEYKKALKELCEDWAEKYQDVLFPLQREAARKDTPEYPLENALVYNTAYDEFCESDEIKLIVIGDNPGKEEQLERNRKYLVGQSGRLADGFFRRNPELGVDFRKNVIIVNKTPLHTAKTAHLKYLKKFGGEEVGALILESQLKMAELTAKLHQELVAGAGNVAGDGGYRTQLWLVGYSELKGKGIFASYRDCLKSLYEGNDAWNEVFVYQHFSMNCFTKDLKNYMEENPAVSVGQSLRNLGTVHKQEIF